MKKLTSIFLFFLLASYVFADEPSGSTELTIDADDDPFMGSTDSPITLIEFGGFQDPFSKKFHEEALIEIKENYIDTGVVKYVFRDFPLSFHVEGIPAAIAAECANEQGKYWEYHYKLLENQSFLNSTNYLVWANELDLDLTLFESCLADPSFEQEVEDDFDDGVNAGVGGSPSFFIQNPNCNDQVALVGAQSYSVFNSKITDLLNGNCSPVGPDISMIFLEATQFDDGKVNIKFMVKNKGAGDSVYGYKIQVVDMSCINGLACENTFFACDFASNCLSLGSQETNTHELTFDPFAYFPELSSNEELAISVTLTSMNDSDYSNNHLDTSIVVHGAEICEDGIDNDDDGKVDCEDIPACLNECFQQMNKTLRKQQGQIENLTVQNERLTSKVSDIGVLLSEFMDRVTAIFCSQLNICPAKDR